MTKNIFSGLFLVALLFGAFASSGQEKEQASKDDKILQEYFAKNHIKAEKTPTGLYYTINRKGSGENATAGKMVEMKYYGKFLDGKKFDANMDEQYNLVKDILKFPVGEHRVIAGWDEGILHLNKGARATFYIPSGLGYGPQGRGPIPANSIMVFDVELTSFN